MVVENGTSRLVVNCRVPSFHFFLMKYGNYLDEFANSQISDLHVFAVEKLPFSAPSPQFHSREALYRISIEFLLWKKSV
jgi:hypothetical protein